MEEYQAEVFIGCWLGKRDEASEEEVGR